MALVGSFLPKPTMLPMHFSNLQKPKIVILCATPGRPPSGDGSRRQINRTLRLSTKTTVGVGVLKEVTPNSNYSQLYFEEDNLKGKANYNAEDAAAAVRGVEPTD